MNAKFKSVDPKIVHIFYIWLHHSHVTAHHSPSITHALASLCSYMPCPMMGETFSGHGCVHWGGGDNLKTLVEWL